MNALLKQYHSWRRKIVPASKNDIEWRHDYLNARFDALEERLGVGPLKGPMNAEQRLNKLFKFGVAYADSEKLLPPVGHVSDFLDVGYLAANSWLHDEGVSWWKEDLDWAQLADRDPAPIPAAPNREGYNGQHHFQYWLCGYRDYRKTLEAVEPYGATSGRYFDFGGSSGRIFRHFAFQSDNWDVWSSDFKLSSVDWNMRHFPRKIKTFLNNSNPSLPLPDNYFDLVTAYSVFTHINEPETSWLVELRRILRVGGIAYLSIHDEATWKNQEDALRQTVNTFRPDIANAPELPAGKSVVTFREDDPYNCNVFHSRDYIENIWGRYFEICAIKSSYLDRQAVVVCRRTD